MSDRIFYSSSVHDDREIEAVVEVLRSGPQGLWPGRRVVRMEREVAARFGKRCQRQPNDDQGCLNGNAVVKTWFQNHR